MRLSECEPYKWYLVVTCDTCGSKQPLFRDVSNGKARIRLSYKHSCEKCRRVETYDPEQIERYLHIVERRKQPRPENAG